MLKTGACCVEAACVGLDTGGLTAGTELGTIAVGAAECPNMLKTPGAGGAPIAVAGGASLGVTMAAGTEAGGAVNLPNISKTQGGLEPDKMLGGKAWDRRGVKAGTAGRGAGPPAGKTGGPAGVAPGPPACGAAGPPDDCVTVGRPNIWNTGAEIWI